MDKTPRRLVATSHTTSSASRTATNSRIILYASFVLMSILAIVSIIFISYQNNQLENDLTTIQLTTNIGQLNRISTLEAERLELININSTLEVQLTSVSTYTLSLTPFATLNSEVTEDMQQTAAGLEILDPNSSPEAATSTPTP